MFIFDTHTRTHTHTHNECGRGREKERVTESEAGSRLWAVSTEPDAGLEPTNREIMTWAEVGRLTDWATQAPHSTLYLLRTDLCRGISHEIYFLNLNLNLFIYLFDRERERERASRGRGRGRERENLKQAQHSAWCRAWSLGSWPELKPRVGRSTNWSTQMLLL